MKFEDFRKEVELKDDDNNCVRFDIVDCTSKDLTKKQVDYLGIIKGDIYEACCGAENVNNFIVVLDWNDSTYAQSIKLVLDYVNDNEEYHDTPIFMVVGDNYKFIDLVLKSSFDLGFYPADFLCYLENNRVLIKVKNRYILDKIAKNHYSYQLRAEKAETR